MTPADLARQNAISFECKKDTLRQNQSGDWKIAFTVQGLDMDERLTKAFPGTRYMAVLVEIGTDELPVQSKAFDKIAAGLNDALEIARGKEVMPHSRESVPTGPDNAQPQPDKSAGAKRMEWREMQPAAQAGIRCAEPSFWVFLSERQKVPVGPAEAPDIVRFICGVKSRSELGTNAKARVIWHQLDSGYQAWRAVSCER